VGQGHTLKMRFDSIGICPVGDMPLEPKVTRDARYTSHDKEGDLRRQRPCKRDIVRMAAAALGRGRYLLPARGPRPQAQGGEKPATLRLMDECKSRRSRRQWARTGISLAVPCRRATRIIAVRPTGPANTMPRTVAMRDSHASQRNSDG